MSTTERWGCQSRNSLLRLQLTEDHFPKAHSRSGRYRLSRRRLHGRYWSRSETPSLSRDCVWFGPRPLPGIWSAPRTPLETGVASRGSMSHWRMTVDHNSVTNHQKLLHMSTQSAEVPWHAKPSLLMPIECLRNRQTFSGCI